MFDHNAWRKRKMQEQEKALMTTTYSTTDKPKGTGFLHEPSPSDLNPARKPRPYQNAQQRRLQQRRVNRALDGWDFDRG